MPQIVKEFYNTKAHTESNSLAVALHSQPDLISRKIVNTTGLATSKSTLLTLTEGIGNVEYINGHEYEYPIESREKKARPVTSDTVETSTGVYKLTFSERWFIPSYVVVSGSGVLLRLSDEEPLNTGSGFEYTATSLTDEVASSLPAKDKLTGSRFAQMFSPAAYDFSRGNASNWKAPALIKDRVGVLRKSYSIGGGAANYVSRYELKTKDGKTVSLWAPYEEHVHYNKFKEECYNYYIYSKSSYDSDFIVKKLFDNSNRPIHMPPGLLAQIAYKDTYSVMTRKKLDDILTTLYFGMDDSFHRHLVVVTGSGGIREFHNSFAQDLEQKVWQRNDSPIFYNDKGGQLTLGKYFTQYQHIDKKLLTIIHDPLLDLGSVAEASHKHPITNLPLESYRMIFIDNSRYEHGNNLCMISRRNRSLVRWHVSGSTTPTGDKGNTTVSRGSDVDGYSVHYLKESQLVLKRFNTSFDLQCVAF